MKKIILDTEKLESMRKRQGLTITKWAGVLGISTQAYYGALKHRSMGNARICMIAEKVGVEPLDLLKVVKA